MAGHHIMVGDASWPLRLVRHARARSYRLRLDPARGEVRLTMPSRGAAGPALVWAQGQTPWLCEQYQRHGPQRVEPGSIIPLDGQPRRIDWDTGHPRRVTDTGAALLVGGPHGSVGPRLARWLKERARDQLTADITTLAQRAALPLGRVSIGDPRRRWGSCNTRGDVRFSWRLTLMPRWVQRAIVAHEAAHLVHMHHGPAFHALLRDLLGESPAAADRWLKTEGAALLRLDFGIG